MEARELRIGNWVLDKKEVKQIQNVLSEEYAIENGFKSELDNMKPIPLTEEWLVKFGFEKDTIYWVLSDNEDNYVGFTDILCYDLSTKEFIVVATEYDRFDVDIKHVHSLQNLYFALTGEELTIKKVRL